MKTKSCYSQNIVLVPVPVVVVLPVAGRTVAAAVVVSSVVAVAVAAR